MRYIFQNILNDLKKKMVFVGGPRQCGKTHLAKEILKAYPYQGMEVGKYYNWDFTEDKNNILKSKWVDSDKLIVLDELHKYPKWKNLIKGIYDKQGDAHKFLITGSARLDTYKKGGILFLVDITIGDFIHLLYQSCLTKFLRKQHIDVC